MEQRELKQGLRVKTPDKGEGTIIGFFQRSYLNDFKSGKSFIGGILVKLDSDQGHGGSNNCVDFNGLPIKCDPYSKNYWFYDYQKLTKIGISNSINKSNTSLEDTISMLEEMDKENEMVVTKILPKYPSTVSSIRKEVLEIANKDANEKIERIDPSVFNQSLPFLNTNF